jgi:hypothetical protein
MLELSQPETLWQHANLDANILALNIVVKCSCCTYLPGTSREERSAESQDDSEQTGDQLQFT